MPLNESVYRKKQREDEERAKRERAVELARGGSATGGQSGSGSYSTNSSDSSQKSTQQSQRGSQDTPAEKALFKLSGRTRTLDRTDNKLRNKYDTEVLEMENARKNYGTRGTKNSRVKDTVKGAGKQWLGGQLSSIGTSGQSLLTDVESLHRAKAEEDNPYYNLRSREDAERRETSAMRDLNRKEGVDIKNAERAYDLHRNENEYSEDYRKLLGGIEKTIKTGDTLQESGQKDIERAKEGANGFQKFLIDSGAQMLQWSGDAGLRAIPVVGQALSIASFMNRAGGMSSYQARQEGMNPDQQFFYQQGSALMEGISELTFQSVGALRATYGKGMFSIGDKLVNKASTSGIVDRLFRTELGNSLAVNMARLGGGALEEGFEEVETDLVDPVLKYMIKKSADPNAEFEGWDIKQMGYDFLMGATMGGVLGGVEVPLQVKADLNIVNDDAYNEGYAESLIKQASVQGRTGEGGRTLLSNAEVLAEQFQKQIDEGKALKPAQIRMLEEAVGQSTIENSQQLRRKKDVETAKSRNEGTYVEDRGTRIEVEEFEKGAQSLYYEKAEKAVNAIGKSATSEGIEAVASVDAGTATASDIDTVLQSPNLKMAVEQMVNEGETDPDKYVKIPINNREARTVLENLTAVRNVANRNKVLQEVQERNAEAITASLTNMSESGGDLLAKHVGEAEDLIGDVRIYRDRFSRLYTDGATKGADFDTSYKRIIEDVGDENLSQLFSKDFAMQIFNEGKKTLATNNAKAVAKNMAEKYANRKGGISFERGAEELVSKREADALQKFGERAGVEIRIVRTLSEDENGNALMSKSGKRLTVNGTYHDGVITIASDTNRKLITVAKHELTHHIKETSPERYQELEDFVFERWYHGNAEEMEDEINRYMQMYSRQGLDREGVKEEIIADASEAFFTDESAIQDVLTFSEKLGKAISDGIHSLLDTFLAIQDADPRAFGRGGQFLKELDILREAERMWLKALDSSVQAKKGAKGTNTEATAETETKHSLGYHAGDLGKSTGDDYFGQGYYRGTGHFGFGTYFVGDKAQVGKYGYENRPVESVDFDKYNLYKPRNYDRGIRLHEALKIVNGYAKNYSELKRLGDYRNEEAREERYYKTSGILRDIDEFVWEMESDSETPSAELKSKIDKYFSDMPEYYRDQIEQKAQRQYERDGGEYDLETERYYVAEDVVKDYIDKLESDINKVRSLDFELTMGLGFAKNEAEIDRALAKTEEIVKGYPDNKRGLDSASTVFMKQLGYDGVDVRGIKGLDNTTYGSVIYDLKDEDLARKKEIGTAKYSVSPEDQTYLDAVNRGDMDTAQRMVEQEARKKGYNSPLLYSGSDHFGFTKIDPYVNGGDGSFWASNREDTAGTYTANSRVKQLNDDDFDIDEAIDIADSEIDVSIAEFRYLIDTTFSEWFFGMQDNGYIRDTVLEANPIMGNGDGVYDVLEEMVADAYYNYKSDIEGDYEDFAEWQETSPEAEKIFSAIVGIESARLKLYELQNDNSPYGKGGIYQLYANTNNMYEVDAKGSLWDNLRPEGLPKIQKPWSDDAPYKTRDVVKWAKDNGYDGVIFRNIKDNGQYGRTGDADVYAFLNPTAQVKSADPVTYDDEGNVIPLSERFKESNEDIRYSVAEDSDGNTLSEGQREYFKDSKVRDDEGRLLKMYHGTSEAGFTVFNGEYGKSSKGIFFTDNLTIAKGYSGTHDILKLPTFKSIEEVKEAIRKDMDAVVDIKRTDGKYVIYEDGDYVDESENLNDLYNLYNVYSGFGGESANYGVYLNATNPLVIDAHNKNWDELSDPNKNIVDREWEVYTNDNGKQVIEYTDRGGKPVRVTDKELQDSIGWDLYDRMMVRWFEEDYGHVYTKWDTDANKISDPVTTNFIVNYAQGNGYDGVIFRNIVDTGLYSTWQEKFPSTVAVVFEPDQIKLTSNENPTENEDIRYSVSYTEEEMDAHRKALEDEAIEYYDEAYTDDYNESGYVFPNGKMLKMGAYGQRGEDHAIATLAYDDVGYDTYYSPKNEAQKRFINEGNIRFMPENGSLNLGTQVEPTYEQYAWIRRFINDVGASMIEFTDMDDNSVDSKRYSDWASADEVINDIKRFYRDGKIGGSRLSEFRYSVSEQEELRNLGADVTEGGSVAKFSVESWDETDVQALRQRLIDADNDPEVVDKWIADTNSMSANIVRNELKYRADRSHNALKANSEYYYTLDLSTLCAKRKLYQGTFNAIMHSAGMENVALLPKDVIHLRALMAEMGYEVPCGICYEESRKKNEPKFAKQWLYGYKTKTTEWAGYANMKHDDPYIPTLADVLTTDGRSMLQAQHPEVLEAYLNFQKGRGSANPKVSRLHTDYRSEILDMTKGDIKNVKKIGGLRIQSFSDFELPHVLDMMQAILDMSAMGLTSQAYTKVPAFAQIFGNTGIKINLSLIGQAVDGKLVFDDKEGIDHRKAFKLRKKFDKNVGTILVGANEESVLLAWADPRIDMVIPFHRSGWSKSEFKALGLGGYEDFQAYQTERYILNEEEARILTEKDKANPKKKKPHTYKAGETITLAMAKSNGFSESGQELYSNGYWDGNLSGKENAEVYLRKCAELHRRPVFYELLQDNGDGTWSLKPDGSTDGYWKSLIDFKMYDSMGKFARQEVVKPIFNMQTANDIMRNFEGDPDNLPVADDVVKQFVKDYKGGRKYKLVNDKVKAGDVLPKIDKNAKMSLSESEGEPNTKAYRTTISKIDSRVSDLKADIGKTKGKTLDLKETSVQAGRLLKRHDGNMSVHKNVTTAIKDIADLYNSKNISEAEKVAQRTAVNIVNSIRAVHDEGADEYKAIKEHLKGLPITVSEDIRNGMNNYNDFRTRFFGRLNLKNGETSNIGDVYDQLIELFPEQFTEDYTTPIDQLNHIADVMDNYVPYYEALDGASVEMQDYVVDIATDLMETAYKLHTHKKFTNAEQESKAKEYKTAREDALKSRNIAVYRDTKQRYETKISALKQRGKDYKADVRERAEKKRRIAQIAKIHKRLLEKLQVPKDTKHLPNGYAPIVSKVLSMFDFTTEGMEKWAERNGEPSKRYRYLDELRMQLEGMSKPDSNKEDVGIEIDPDLIKLVDELKADVADNERLSDMDSAKLEDIATLFRAFEHQINSYNKAFDEQNRQTVLENRDNFLNETRDKKNRKERQGVIGWFQSQLEVDNTTPADFFHLIGGTPEKLYTSIRKGFDKHVLNVANAMDFVRETVSGKDAQKWSETVKEYTTSFGDKIKLTDAQLMSIYCLSKREQAQQHMYSEMGGGGIVVSPQKVGKGLKAETLDRAKVVVNSSDIQKWISQLTDKQRTVAEQFQRYLSEDMSKLGNETSLKLYGYKKFTEKYYFPIQSSENWLASTFDFSGGDAVLKNTGMTKAVNEKANAPIVIDDIFTVASKHISTMSLYNALVPSLTDFQRFWNSKDKEHGTTVKEQFTRVYGEPAFEYVENFMRDLNGSYKRGFEVKGVDKLLTLYKQSSIGLNLRVFVQQPTAIARAGAVMNPTYIAKALGASAGTLKDNLSDMREHCPIALWKSWGFYNTDLARDMRSIIMDEKKFSDNFSKAYGVADDVTWSVIFKAVRYEVEAENKNLEVGSDEYWEKVNERATEVFDRTQVVDSPFHRSQNMRAKGTFSKMVTAFMAEPTKTYNMLKTELTIAKREIQSGQKGKGIKRASRVLQVFVTNAMLVSASSAFIDALRGVGGSGDDDKDKNWFERFLAHWWSNTKDNINPLGLLPLFRDVQSAINDYDIERMDMQAIARMVKSLKYMGEYLKDPENSKYTAINEADYFLQQASYLTGVPYVNIRRDVRGIALSIAEAVGYDDLFFEEAKLKYQVNEKTKSMWRTMYLDAKYKGNTALAKKIHDYIVGDVITQEYIDKGEKDYMKANKTDAQQQKFDSTMNTLKTSPVWNNATSKRQSDVENLAEKLSVGIDDGDTQDFKKVINEGAKYGLTEEEYMLYKLAKSAVADGNANTSDEKREALRMLTYLHLSEKEKQLLMKH